MPRSLPFVVVIDALAVMNALMQQVGDFPDALPPRPPWMADGLCRETPEVDFFPRVGGSAEPAREVCRRCLVKDECLSWAIAHGESGVWGATTERERRQLVRFRAAAA